MSFVNHPCLLPASKQLSKTVADEAAHSSHSTCITAPTAKPNDAAAACRPGAAETPNPPSAAEFGVGGMPTQAAQVIWLYGCVVVAQTPSSCLCGLIISSKGRTQTDRCWPSSPPPRSRLNNRAPSTDTNNTPLLLLQAATPCPTASSVVVSTTLLANGDMTQQLMLHTHRRPPAHAHRQSPASAHTGRTLACNCRSVFVWDGQGTGRQTQHMQLQPAERSGSPLAAPPFNARSLCLCTSTPSLQGPRHLTPQPPAPLVLLRMRSAAAHALDVCEAPGSAFHERRRALHRACVAAGTR